MASWELAEWEGVARQGELPVREVGCCRKDDDCRELAAVRLKWLKNTFEKRRQCSQTVEVRLVKERD